MQSVIEHIAHEYPKPVYSEIYYQECNIANGVVEKNFTDEGARAILTLHLYWEPVISPGANPVFSLAELTFTDQFNQVLFRSVSNGTAWAPVWRVLKGQQLKITVTPIVKFQVAYQYIL